jgi:biotin carboxyl carrier protein
MSILINGTEVAPAEDASVVETEPGVFSVLIGGKSGGSSFEARVSGSEIAIAGEVFQYELLDPRQWKRSGAAAGAHGRASIIAPMPGKVVRVMVSVGDEVVAGQGIVVVEAMKMQNEMKAPRDGRVTAVEVRENDSVNAGTVLAAIE